jgi:outer membrane protein assembly factor BamB
MGSDRRNHLAPMGNREASHAEDGRGTRRASMRRDAVLALAVSALWCAGTGCALAWTARVNGTRAASESGGPAVADAFGNVFVGGQLTTAATGANPTVVKLAGTTEVWRYVAHDVVSSVQALAVDPSGHAIAAFAVSSPATNRDWAVTKLDATTGTPLWRTTLDGGAAQVDFVSAVAVDADGNVFAAGDFYDLQGHSQFAAVKLDGATGAEMWRLVVPATASIDHARDIGVGPQGVAVCGTYDANFLVALLDPANGDPLFATGIVPGEADRLVTNADSIDAVGTFYDVDQDVLGAIRVESPMGGVRWVYSASGDDMSSSSSDHGNAIAPVGDGSGDVYVAGGLRNAATGQDGFVARIDGTSGVGAWLLSFDGGGEDVDDVFDLIVDGAHRPILGGYVTTAVGNEDGFAMQLDAATGAVRWTATVDGSGHGADALVRLALDGAGGGVATGNVFEGVPGTRMLVLRLRADDGAETGRLVLGGDGVRSNDRGSVVARDPHGDVLIGGFTNDASPDRAPPLQFTAAKFDGRRGTERWRFTLPGSGDVRAIEADADGNVFAAGRAEHAPDQDDATIVKLSPDGAVAWVRRLDGGSDGDVADGLAVTAGGTVYVAGHTVADVTDYDAFVLKLDGAGTELWRRTFVEPGTQSLRAVAVDAAGDVVVGGTRPVGGAGQWWIAKLAGSDGAERWSTTVGGSSAGSSNFIALAVDPVTSDVVAVGVLADETVDFGVVRVAAATGTEMWRAVYHGTLTGSLNIAKAVAIDRGGEILAAGHLDNVATSDDAFVVKLGPDKTQRWTHTVQVQTDGPDTVNGVAFDADGNAVVCGKVAVAESDRDALFLGIEGTGGNEIWRRTIGGSGDASNDECAAFAVDTAGITAAGVIETPGTFLDMAAFRLGPRGIDAACVKTSPEDPGCRPCAQGCDDADACTSDACDATEFCIWTPVDGDAATTCGFDRGLSPSACSGVRVPRKIVRTFVRSGANVRKGMRAPSPPKAQKAFRRGSRLLGRVLVLVDKAGRRRRRPLPAPCAAALRALVQDTKARVDARLGG